MGQDHIYLIMFFDMCQTASGGVPLPLNLRAVPQPTPSRIPVEHVKALDGSNPASLTSYASTDLQKLVLQQLRPL